MTRAVAKVEQASASEKMRRLAFRRQLAEMDMVSRLHGSRKKGLEEGLAKGEAKGRMEGRVEGRVEGRAENQTEVARRMLQRKMPLADIAALSGLSEVAVKRLAAEKKP